MSRSNSACGIPHRLRDIAARALPPRRSSMLLALGLRGVSFGFSYQTVASRKRWDAQSFGFGSIVADGNAGSDPRGPPPGHKCERRGL